jgi:hypothetical protein
MTDTSKTDRTGVGKLSTSTLVNFFALIALFMTIFLVQRFGVKAPDEAMAPAPQAEEQATKTEQPASETIANAPTAEAKTIKLPEVRSEDRTIEAAGTPVPTPSRGISAKIANAEELDNEQARQNYIAANAKAASSAGSKISRPMVKAIATDDSDDYIPFEKSSGTKN